MSACKKTDIRTFRVPKESIPLVALEQRSNTPLTWTIPDHWEKQSLTTFRKASYLVPHPSLPDVMGDFSIVSFPGDAGGLLNNVNRWRNQLSLPPISETERHDIQYTIQHDSLDIIFFDFITSPSSTGDKKRLLIGTFLYHNERYFFKLTGPYDLLDTEKVAFMSILRTLSHD